MASILDIPQMLIYAIREPIPEAMDGKPLTEQSSTEFGEERSIIQESLSTLASIDSTAAECDTEDCRNG